MPSVLQKQTQSPSECHYREIYTVNGWSGQIWILLLSSSGRRALWDVSRKWENDTASMNSVYGCECGGTSGLWKAWQGSRALLTGEVNVISCDCSQWTCHHQRAWPSDNKRGKEAISPSFNPLSPSLSPTHHASFHYSSVSPLLSFLIHLSSPPILPPLCPNPSSPNSPKCFIHHSFKSSLLLLHLQLHSESPTSRLILSLSLFTCLLSYDLLYFLRGQTAGCAAIRVCPCHHMRLHTVSHGEEERKRGTKAIAHSMTRCLQCHIKGERVIL